MMRPSVVLSVALAAAVSVSIASAATLRKEGADDDAGGSIHNKKFVSYASIWPFDSDSDSDVKNGITFERTETSFPLLHHEEGSMWRRLLPSGSSHFFAWAGYYMRSSLAYLPAGFQVQSSLQPLPSANFDSGHCQSNDEYGGNICHYDWDDDITIDYDGRLGQEQLDEDVYIEISANIDSMIHHKQTCQVCGDDPCIISVEAIPTLKWSLKLPPCPLTPDLLYGEWKKKLPGKSPIPGMLSGSSGTIIEGTVWLKKRNGHEDDGDILMEVKANVRLK